MTLEELQSAGALPTTLGDVSFDRSVPISVVLKMSATERSLFDGVIVADDCEWAATARKLPIERATSVYSGSHDGKLGQYRKDTRTYYYKEYVDGSLVTTNLFQLEEKRMDNNVTFDPAAFAQEMQQGAAVTPATSFGENAGEKTRVDRVAQYNQQVQDARKKIGSGKLANRTDIVANNQKYGRLVAFITKTDSVTKPEVVKTKDKSGAVISRDIVFKNASPGTVKGAILQIPAGSDVSLTKLGADQDLLTDEANKSTKIQFLSVDAAHTKITTLFDKKIRESEAVMGDKATIIFADTQLITNKEGEQELKTSLKLEDKQKRSTLLTEGNYFPIAAYKTINTVDMSAEDKACADLNIKAIISPRDPSKGTTYEQLSDASKQNVKLAGDTVTSTWFDNGMPISAKRYDNKEEDVAVVAVPRRVIKKSKDGDKIQYKFEYFTPEETVASPKYRGIVEATGLSTETFLAKLKPFTTRKSSGKNQRDTISADDYLLNLRKGALRVNGKQVSFESIISEINADSMID